MEESIEHRLSREAVVVFIFGKIWRNVRQLIIDESKLLQARLTIKGERATLDDIYARVKLCIASKMLSECHDWTIDNCEVKQ